MGLIAREIESRGIPTICMSSARSITAAVNPPRAVYLDYPLGHTSGKPEDPANQMAVMEDTLAAVARIEAPGTIIDLMYQWRDDDSWKDAVMRPRPQDAAGAGGGAQSAHDDSHEDDRVERFDTPQYQTEADAQAAQQPCSSCVFLEESA